MVDNYNGAVDNQTAEQKNKNFKLEEVCASISPVVWEERSYRVKYPIRNQDGSSTCVTQTLATEMGIIFEQKYGEFIDFSAAFPYKQRGGTYGGCNSNDIYSIFPKLGDIFESIMPSQDMGELEVAQLELKSYYKDLAKPFTVKRIELPIDFETVASTIQATKKGVMVWFRFSHPEWTDIPVALPQPTTSGHSVTAVDFILKNGKKYLVIQDSWGLAYAINGYRLISEEYFKARCFLASYLKTFQSITIADNVGKPFFTGSIMSAQQCFKYEGLFPGNVAEVENWGNITRTACKAFQLRYNINPPWGNFGPLTKAKLKQLYG